ncbi:uncharacterized protein [Paramisgurnus dabryanus]|uniref:uncharacterized protein n=1 Tax=Paramisgurnus dabryanus TaxID=90735 RepID=UPI0031F35E79
MGFLMSLCVALLLMNEVRSLNPSTTSTTTTESASFLPITTTASVDNLNYDPCYNYTSLDRPWRATNESGLYICDESFYWEGWYRLYYNGMNIRMSESCVSSYSCNTYVSLWLSSGHPQIEDGVVTRQLMANAWGYCGYYYYNYLQSIQVKACPGGYYVYELINPQFWCSAYCTDINTLTEADPSTNPDMVNGYSTTLPFTITNYDPCYNYKTLDNEWRNTRTYCGVQYDDTMTEWDGWYRLFINGMNAEIPEWCLNDMTCGGYSPLWLNDSHPRLEDGVVTLEVYSSSRYGQCSSYRSNSIEVKACPDNYYVYKLTRPSVTIPAPVYCAVAFTSLSIDPCDNYTSLDDSWRSSSNYYYYYSYYYGVMCDYNMNWNGWYRLYYQGQDAQMPESCVNYGSCGTSQPLWLNGRHPQLEDGVVTRKICGSTGIDCCGHTSQPIRVKACPGNYYVYEFVSPTSCSAYCTEVRDLNPSTTPSATTKSTTPVPITASMDNLSNDPCYNYTSLDRPWRATNESGLYICDESFYWDGWYRLYYNGMNIRMSESCVSSYSCNAYVSLWLSSGHPQIEDGVVTRQLLANAWGYCGYYYYLQSIQVKACPGGYYVYELINPQFWCSAYCTDINTLTEADPSTNPDMVNEYSTTMPSTITSYDPCYNYKTLDNEWRNTRTYCGVQYDDTMTEWDGWYRLFINGMNAEIPEWCLNDMTCGGYSPLWLNGSHPRLEDGVVTLEVYSSSRYGQCSSYRSNSIEVKACPDNYYVYKLTRPSVTIPAPVYCAVAFTSLSIDPCDSYTSLDDSWRSTSQNYYYYNYGGMCDYNMNWNGWYRLYYQGQDAQMPESCVNYGSCGTSQPLWLNGHHPQLEDGVVTRKICGSTGNDCCGYTSHPIRVKACPGNYYVYEFVSPTACSAYCTEVRDLNPSTTPSTTTESTTPVPITASMDNLSNDPCYNYTSLDRPWRATNESGLYICDESFYWDGWYRLYYNGMNIRMSESCVSSYSCNAYVSLWLSSGHPQIEDGVVTRQLLTNAWGYCGYYNYYLQSIQVKACPGGYYVYELVNPQFSCSAYCTDINTLTEADPSTNPDMVNGYSTTLPSTITNYDPCYNYKTIDNEWRNTRTYCGVQYDDTMTEWDGWYRLFINGMNAEIPEWCLNDMTCGGYSPLWLNDSHPRLEDGVVTLEVYSSSRYGKCSSYRSNSIEVKACPDNYYVYKLTRPSVTIPAPVYCAVAFTSLIIDPCDSYTSLDDSWRSSSNYNYYYSYYYGVMCDYNMNWNGWYRLYYQGQDAQMPESCVNYGSCGTSQPLWLNGRHPQLEDGVVTRKICGSTENDCCGYTSHPIRVKACPGNYYVYEFVSPTSCSAYCTEVRDLNPSTTPSTTTRTTASVSISASMDNLSYDPCYNYTSLDRPWRATNESGLYICDEYFSWHGWYRLYYNGMNIRMSEDCVSSYSCNAYVNFWLSGGHPQIEDGVVTRQVFGSYWRYCFYFMLSIQVKACSGGYFVYELVSPQSWCSGYCTDINTLTEADLSTNPTGYSTTLSSTITSYDPCYNYKTLDNEWRNTRTYCGVQYDDTMTEWDGWYRLFIKGMNAEIPEWCLNDMTCGGYSPLWLNGSHPRLEDGVVTLEVYSSSRYGQCSSYRSNSIEVKACPDNYYVYKLTRPSVTIPAPVYCAVAFTSPSIDPCDSYTSLDDSWRSTSNYNYYYGVCDYNMNWNGWYRLYYQGQDAQMPESCVDYGYCGTSQPLWLNGRHPQLEDGVVTRKICGSTGNDCCGYTSHPIRVKACPGNYYVYEFVTPTSCSAYCTEVRDLNPPTTLSTTTTESTTPVPITVAFNSPSIDPCDSYTSLDDSWRSTSNYNYYYYYYYNYYSGMCDYNMNWNGWYRLYYQGQDAQMPESCVNYGSCGTSQPLWLNGRHPQLEDGVVTRQVCGSTGNDCCGYTSYPIQVKACPGNYYVYEFVSPSSCSAYCTEVRDLNPLTTLSTTTTESTTPVPITVAFNSPSIDPCDSYTSLDDSWRSTSNYNYYYYYYYNYYSGMCDYNMNWNGWYRLYYQGQDAQMPESCVNYGSCGTFQPLWLNGRHPQLEDGVVTRQVCGSSWLGCFCDTFFPIQVKACPGNYYVYEFVSPSSCSAYCTEVRDLNPLTTLSTTTTESTTPVPITVAFNSPSIDPCDSYTSLDDSWRSTSNYNYYYYYYYNYYSGMCDYNMNWNGWYRLYYQGQDAQMPESCVNYGSCGTSQPLWLNGRHPQLENGVVTRKICGSTGNDCCGYTSHPIQVKACPGNYYVYEFVSPTSCSAYCTEVRDLNPLTTLSTTTTESTTPVPITVAFNSPSIDPCDSYTSLDDSWRSTSNYNYYYYYYYNYYGGMCDYNMNWNGWYRLYYQGQDAQMPESCVNYGSCGTSQPLWLNGRHPQLEDGVVTRKICGSTGNDCCGYTSHPIRVKACPGNYYVYEFVSPTSCSAYCTEVRDLNPPTTLSTTTTESTTPVPITVAFNSPSIDPCDGYTSLDDSWRATSNYNNYFDDYYGQCDYNMNWNGWYRLYYQGQDAQMPESCVNYGSCGTFQPLWLNGRHPQLEDGVITQQVCGSSWDGCFCDTFNPIQVKACPGNYYVYEFVSPRSCSAYCTEVRQLNPTAASATTEESTTSLSITTIDPCTEINCTEEEWCGEKDGIYGCFCNHPRSDTDSYDSFEICESSSGFLSLSRCQLFEDGFSAEILHLRDARCKGTVQNGRVEFHFDNNNMCGTNLMANGTHFIYENIISGEVKSTQLISRKSHLDLSFSCIYSQTQTISMNAQINPLESHLHRTIPTGEGTYKVRMVPYQDPDFSQPFNGSVNIEVDQPIYVELNVEGIDGQQFALLIDTCWATPVNDPLYNVRWDLLVGECPNPKDDTVVLLQNGVSTSSRFSFRTFAFTENSEKVFLHCSIHICLLMGNDCSAHCESGYHRKPRSVDFHDSSSISMGPLIWS